MTFDSEAERGKFTLSFSSGYIIGYGRARDGKGKEKGEKGAVRMIRNFVKMMKKSCSALTAALLN